MLASIIDNGSGDGVLATLFDGGGNLHEPRIVHAVVDDGAWMQLSSGEPNLGDQVEGRAISLASAAYSPAPAAAAPVGESVAAPVAAPADSPPPSLPSPEAVAAARAKAAALKSGNAVDAIRAEVQARLAHTAKAPTGSAPAPVAPASAAPIAVPAVAATPASAPGNAAAKPANGPAAFPAKVEE